MTNVSISIHSVFFIVYKLPSSQDIPLGIPSPHYFHLWYLSVICFYVVPVTDAAAAPASSSQPTTTTQLQTDEKPSSLVVGMYIVTIILR